VPTLALKLGSPAIDSGGAGSCPATDARGVTRPKDGDNDSTATCDKGAFEFERVTSSGVTISGPDSGLVNSNYTFQATVQPITNTFPITYTWQAEGQADVVQTGSYTSSITFNWNSTGSKTITVTADNGVNSVVDTHQIDITTGTQPLTGVTISGPDSGSQGQAYDFTASVSPGDATTPITYTWVVDGGAPIVQTGQGASAILSGVTFSSDGAHTVAATADNGAGSASDTHTITITSWYANAATGDDNNTCTSPATPCQTVQGAVNKAAAGGTVFVAAGTYNENTVSVNKSLTVKGDGAGTTVVSGDGSQTVFRLRNSGGTSVIILEGMTVRNGGNSGLFNEGAAVTLRGMIVENNSSFDAAGGIYNDGGDLLCFAGQHDRRQRQRLEE